MRAFLKDSIPLPQLSFNALEVLRHSPIDLEIGAGQGLHAIKYCQTNPHRRLLAVESTHSRFTKLEHRKSRHPQLHNLHVIHADAVAFVSHFIPDHTLHRIFILYPNPYPKLKHANLRWCNRPFLGFLKQKLIAEGQLTLATNLHWYAEETAFRLVQYWNFTLKTYIEVDPIGAPRTHFEKKYLARGEKCWNLEFRLPPDIGKL